MFTSQLIGFVSSPYKVTSEIPKGLGAKHEADGVLTILLDFEKGLTDIEGFSHLIIIWEFDRSHRFELLRPSETRRRDGKRSWSSRRRDNVKPAKLVEPIR